jgi:CheY-like chemotaxis protein
LEPGGPSTTEFNEAASRSRPLVLIIEDDPDIGHLIVRMLTPVRYDFLTTSTGVDGLRHARQSRPDVITLDLALPDMDGSEVLARLKASDETKDIPVIVVSIRGDEAHRLAGAFAVMSKPVDRVGLRAAVERAIASR